MAIKSFMVLAPGANFFNNMFPIKMKWKYFNWTILLPRLFFLVNLFEVPCSLKNYFILENALSLFGEFIVIWGYSDLKVRI